MRKNNGQWILKSRPQGLVERVNFEWREEPIPTIRDGQFLVRNLWFSCDPTQRLWMQFDTYIPAVPLGDVMYSMSAGQVVESRHADFKPGDKVTGAWGWQDYTVTDGSGLVPATKIPAGVDFPTALSLFGITGLTAYFGLLDLAAPQAGDVVVVSAAAGSTGSFVAQIAKLKGCRVIGIAGGEKKCTFLTKDLSLDGRSIIVARTSPLGFANCARTGSMCTSTTSGGRFSMPPWETSPSAHGSWCAARSPATTTSPTCLQSATT